MPLKHHRNITEYVDSDNECPTLQPCHIIQTHTHIQPTLQGIATSNTCYEMLGSPDKWPAHTAHEPILWREDEPMSLGHNIAIYSDNEDDMDHTERILEPGYVSTVCDKQVKHMRGFLGVSCSNFGSSFLCRN